MDTRHGDDSTDRPGERHAPRPHLTALFVALLALVVSSGLFAAAAPAGAATAPGKPAAKAPAGTITTTKPTFKWSKATGAAKYELRAYRGTRQVLKKTGLTKLSWTTTKALPKNVALAWKVRASNVGGTGAWSKSLKFKVVPLSSAKAITAFSFASPAVVGTVTEADRTIALTVPVGTADAGLVATFTTSGASVAVGATPQVSGTTANDFTSVVTYTVTAADSTTRAYSVTVYRIGKSFQGGKIAYILQSGDPGYRVGQTHGLIAAAADQSTTMAWSNIATTWVATTGSAIGTGQANTAAIVGQLAGGVSCTSGAAYACDHLVEGGYADWYLPSSHELNKLLLSKVAIGGFSVGDHWSSTEWAAAGAESQYFFGLFDGLPGRYSKSVLFRVRAVRSF